MIINASSNVIISLCGHSLDSIHNKIHKAHISLLTRIIVIKLQTNIIQRKMIQSIKIKTLISYSNRVDVPRVFIF